LENIRASGFVEPIVTNDAGAVPGLKMPPPRTSLAHICDVCIISFHFWTIL